MAGGDGWESTGRGLPRAGATSPGQGLGTDWQGEGLQDARGLGSVPTTCAGVWGTAGSPSALGPPSEPQWPLQAEVAEPRPLCQAPSSDQGPGWPWLDCASPRQVHSVGTFCLGGQLPGHHQRDAGPTRPRGPGLPGAHPGFRGPCCPARAPGVRGAGRVAWPLCAIGGPVPLLRAVRSRVCARMCVCSGVCAHVCVLRSVRACACARECVHTCACAQKCARVCVCSGVCARVCVFRSVCTRERVLGSVCTRVCAQKCARVCMCSGVCAHVCMCSEVCARVRVLGSVCTRVCVQKCVHA